MQEVLECLKMVFTLLKIIRNVRLTTIRTQSFRKPSYSESSYISYKNSSPFPPHSSNWPDFPRIQRTSGEKAKGFFFSSYVLLSSPHLPLSPTNDRNLGNKVKFRMAFASNSLRIITVYMNLGMASTWQNLANTLLK